MPNLLGARHQKVSRLRKLLRNGRYRASEGVCALEGATLLTEAIRNGVELESIFFEGDDAALAGVPLAGQRVYRLSPGTVERVATTQTPQPVLSIARWGPLPSLDASLEHRFVVVAADVREPGNLGTMIRSSVAAGADAFAVVGSSVDVTNPKVLRASAGTAFSIPMMSGPEAVPFVSSLQTKQIRVLGLSLDGSSLYDEDLTRPVALVLGNEAQGLDARIAKVCDAVITIPQSGPAESLNVAMASTVAAFEVARQRGYTQGRLTS